MSNHTAFLREEMRARAMVSIIDWFADMMRVRLASHSLVQRSMTLLTIEAGLNEVLRQHEHAALRGTAEDHSELRAFLYRETFDEAKAALLVTMGSGFTREERDKLGLIWEFPTEAPPARTAAGSGEG